MRAIIIDDEKQSHDALAHLLYPAYKDVQVVGHGYTVQEGLELASTHKPDLVFLDVELPDGTGFDLIQQLGKPDFNLVFITAHNKYAESAIRFGALDFLTKPIESVLLAETIGRARERLHERVTLIQLQIAIEAFQGAQSKKLPSRICISTYDGFDVVAVDNIIHLVAAKNLTEFHILDRKKKLMSVSNLGIYDKQFEPYPTFWRAHRSHIVNLQMVDRFVKGDGGYLLMRDGCQIPVSKENRTEFPERMVCI